MRDRDTKKERTLTQYLGLICPPINGSPRISGSLVAMRHSFRHILRTSFLFVFPLGWSKRKTCLPLNFVAVLVAHHVGVLRIYQVPQFHHKSRL